MNGKTSIVDEVEMHGQTVKRFQSLCDMHRVPFGEPGNLNDLVTSLHEDRHFAMDFWAMIGDLSARERGTLSDDEMLEAVVQGSSGLSVAAAEKDYEKLLQELRQMLAGVDVSTPELPAPIAEPKDQPFSQERMEQQRAFAQQVLRRKAERSVGSPTEKEMNQGSIAETLHRLEQSNRELVEQLTAMKQESNEKEIADSSPIAETDKRKIREENQQTKDSSSSEVKGGVQSQEIPINRDARPIVSQEQEVFAPRPMHSLSRRGLVPSDPDDDPSIGVPLAAYAEENQRSAKTRVAILLLLVLLIGVVWFGISHGYGRQLAERYTPWVKEKLGLFQQEVHDVGKKSEMPPASHPTVNTPPTSQPVVEQPSARPTPQPAANQTSSATPPTPEIKKKLDQLPVPKQQSVPVPAAHSVPVERSTAREQLPSLTEAEEGAVRVPASTMESNLMSSRVPIYPETAKAMGIEGTVVVETVISPLGTVELARAISGDPHLRAAAEECVQRWKYKPHLLNGRPAKVVTQVRIAFRLP